MANQSREKIVSGYRSSSQDDCAQRLLSLPPLRSLLFHLIVDSSVLDRDSSLRRDQLQELYPVTREGAGDQIVFKIEHSDETPLLEHRRAKDRARPTASHVFIGGVAIVGASIRQDDALQSSSHVVDDALRQAHSAVKRKGVV